MTPPRPGALLRGVFPRMSGKARPALVVFAPPSGAAALCPLTSRKSAQPGALALRPEELPTNAAALTQTSWILAPLTTLFPAGCARLSRFEPIGALTPAALARCEEAMNYWYGANWREDFAARAERIAKPARLTPRAKILR